MRVALRGLKAVEATLEPTQRANVVLFCDSDVIFRSSRTLVDLAKTFTDGGAAFAGELRHHLFPYPEAQASFLAVRRDWLERRDTAPPVNHGSPLYWMQRSIWRHGGVGIDFPSNHGGYILHRGRSGVAAANRYHRGHPWARAENRDPHFMGVPGGALIWESVETRRRELLLEGHQRELIAVLADRLDPRDIRR
jgi:hypothetical protein